MELELWTEENIFLLIYKIYWKSKYKTYIQLEFHIFVVNPYNFDSYWTSIGPTIAIKDTYTQVTPRHIFVADHINEHPFVF